MKSMRKTMLAFAAISFLLANAKAIIIKPEIAKVNDQLILRKDFDEAYESLLEQYIRSNPQIKENTQAQAEIKRRLLDQMVDKELLFQSAGKNKIEATEAEINRAVSNIKQNFAMSVAKDGKPPEAKELDKLFTAELKNQGLDYEKFKSQVSKDISVNKYIQKEVFSKVKNPSEKEIKKLFDDAMKLVGGDKSGLEKLNQQELQSHIMLARSFQAEMQAKVRASHILIAVDPKADKKQQEKLRKKAMKVYDEAKAKKKDANSFAELAEKYSDDESTKHRGGDMGIIVKGTLPPPLKPLESKAFSLDVGEIGEPVKTPYGYHILKVTAREAAKTLNFEQTKGELAKFIIMQRRQEKLGEVVENLRSKAKIKIYAFEPDNEKTKKEIKG